MREYYIRKEGDEEANGPYNIDQITSLVEVGKLEKEAYVYDVDQENWITIEECEELMTILFPQKKKLTLQVEKEKPEEGEGSEEAESGKIAGLFKKSSKQKDGEPEEEPKKSVSVTAMLAQAEGRDRDDPSGRSPVEKRATAAYLGLRFTTLFVFAAAATMIFLEWDLVKTANAMRMVESPYLIFAAFDIVVGLVLLLQVTEIYPLVRFRAAIGFGTLTILFLTSGDTLLALANAVLSVSMYFCTATLSKAKVIPFCVTGVLGIGGYIALVILPALS